MGEIKQVQDKRRTFVETLNKLAETDKSIVVLIPDVGFNYLSDPTLNFKVINTGVTEQSTTMIAAAMALAGFRVYLYSMIPFVLFRNAEMVRNGIVCHKAPVTIIGVFGSSHYKFLGFSHNLLHPAEDFKFCENIGLKWHDPKDNDEVQKTILENYKNHEASYIRL